MKQYPNFVRMFVADDIREEAGGKQTIVGVYAGDNIQFTLEKNAPAGLPAGLPQLCLFVVFSDGEGDSVAKIELLYPSGKPLHSVGPFSVTKIAGQNMTISCKWSPVVFEETGVYSINVFLDEKLYTHQLTVTELMPAALDSKAS